VDIDVTGTFLVAQAVAKEALKTGMADSLVLVASMSGYVSNKVSGYGFVEGHVHICPSGCVRSSFYCCFHQTQVYLLDAASVDRSSGDNYTSLGTSSHETVQEWFTAPELYDDYPQAKLHTQFPGSGVVGDEIFDQFMALFLPLSYDLENIEYTMRASGCEVLRRIGTLVYTLCHSLGYRYPLLMSKDCPESFLGNINIGAAMTPFWTYNTGLGGSATSAWGFTNTAVDCEPATNSSDDLVTVSVGNEIIAHRDCYLQVEPAR
jgi:hypothetical protein